MRKLSFNFETIALIVKESSELGFNDIKFPDAFGEENIYFMLNQKYNPYQGYRTSKLKNEYEYFFKKDVELK